MDQINDVDGGDKEDDNWTLNFIVVVLENNDIQNKPSDGQT